MSDTENAEPKLIKSQAQPCGCSINTFSDGRKGTAPCEGHGLLEVAHGLKHAAEALGVLGNIKVRAATSSDEDTVQP